ncbi:MAG: HNH endonuclease family protein [Candidatus Limnocylindrus sp.]
MTSRITAVLLILLVSATLALPAPVDAATSAAKACKTNNTKLGLLTALDCLPVVEERIGGYDRKLFKHWVDANGNGKNTRAEVLIAESLVSVRFSSTGKTVSTGKWVSLYDGETWTKASDVDIDHVVALAEAWRSGAWKWSAARRQAYANDLGVAWTLRAVTDNVNQEKSDDDPTYWLPPLESATCLYLIEWVAVKIRWKLSVDAEERQSIRDGWLDARCFALAKPPVVTVKIAP